MSHGRGERGPQPYPARTMFHDHSVSGLSHPPGVYDPRPPHRNDRVVAVRVTGTAHRGQSAQARIVRPIDPSWLGNRHASIASAPGRQAALRVAYGVDSTRPKRTLCGIPYLSWGCHTATRHQLLAMPPTRGWGPEGMRSMRSAPLWVLRYP